MKKEFKNTLSTMRAVWHIKTTSPEGRQLAFTVLDYQNLFLAYLKAKAKGRGAPDKPDTGRITWNETKLVEHTPRTRFLLKESKSARTSKDVKFGEVADDDLSPVASHWKEVSPLRTVITPTTPTDNFNVLSNDNMELDDDFRIALWTILAGEVEGLVYLLELQIDNEMSDWEIPLTIPTVPLA